MEIRRATASDNADILNIHTQAFGDKKGPEIADLVSGLLVDKTALPLLSLVAVDNAKIIGHILFTKAEVTQTTESVSAQILAPLAILPESQRKGVGARLIQEGLHQLKDSGVELVFVLGHPDYYSMSQFFDLAKFSRIMLN